MSSSRNVFVGIVAALPLEAKILVGWSPSPQQLQFVGPSAVISVSGMGAENARQSAVQLLDRGAVGLVSWGLAAALCEEWVCGDIAIPERVVCRDGVHIESDRCWNKDIQRSLGPNHRGASSLAETGQVVRSTIAKLQLAEATQAQVADMESGAVARVASDANYPFVVIRAVLDDLHTSLPSAVLNSIDEYGRTRSSRFMAELLRQPRSVAGLVALWHRSRRAAQSLQRVVSILGPTLGCVGLNHKP